MHLGNRGSGRVIYYEIRDIIQLKEQFNVMHPEILHIRMNIKSSASVSIQLIIVVLIYDYRAGGGYNELRGRDLPRIDVFMV